MTYTEIQLRDYQRECIARITGSWLENMQRPAVVLPTGSGKTTVFSHLAAEWLSLDRGRVVVLVHRDELADQAINELRRTAPGLSVGKVKASDNETTADVMVCSVQTLSRPRRLDQLLRDTRMSGADQDRARPIGMVIIDECFPMGTLVGNTPIDKLRPGDLVPTWNEETGREELRPVVRTMRKTPSAVVRVSLADGTSFSCTPGHPILTDRGWCPAGTLTRGALTVSFTHDSYAGENDLHGMRDSGDPGGESADRQIPAERPGVLFRHLPGHLGTPECPGTDGQDKPGARLGTDEAEQSHAPAGIAGQDGGHSAPYRAQAESAGRERLGSGSPANEACGVPGLGNENCRGTRGRRAPVSLPDGYRPSVHEGSRGSGRRVSFSAGAPNLRPEKGRSVVFTRVAGVQVLEPGSDGTYGGVCPDGAVYNIEVDTTHTYLIEKGTVVHNCHHAAAPSYRTILEALGCFTLEPADSDGHRRGTRAVGFTATLARGDGVGLGDVFDDVVFHRTVLWMIARGYLVDVRARTIDLKLDLGRVKISGGDYQAKSLGDAITAAGGHASIARAVREYAADRRPVVFTPDVASAYLTAGELDRRGITCGVVEGNTSREERQSIYRKYRTGELTALVNCMVLTEGFDAPWADCAVIARPTKSAPLYIQMVGRILRTWPGKKDALVLNVVGEGGTLSTLIDLDPGLVTAVRDGQSLAEAYTAQEERAETAVHADSLAFELKYRDTDLFAASSHSWLRTRAGVMFLPRGDGEVFLWPDTDGNWAVCFAPARGGKWERMHRDLPFSLAMAWAETEAGDAAFALSAKNKRWRKEAAEGRQIGKARSIGITVEGPATKGELSDAISTVLASRKFDDHMRRVEL